MGKNKAQGTKKQTAAKKASAAKGKTKERKTEADTIAAVEKYMADMYNAGVKDVAEEQILKATGYARTDSTGYRKAMKTLLKNLQTVERASKVFTLTDTGIEKLKDSGAITPDPLTNEEAQEQFKEKLHKMAKAPTDKVNSIWDLLADGAVHSRQELLEAAGYTRPDSTGYREIMKWLNKLDLLDKSGKASYQFNKTKLFPFGGQASALA